MPPHPGLSLSWRADGGPRLPPPTPRDDVDMPLHVALAEYSLPGARDGGRAGAKARCVPLVSVGHVHLIMDTPECVKWGVEGGLRLRWRWRRGRRRATLPTSPARRLTTARSTVCARFTRWKEDPWTRCAAGSGGSGRAGFAPRAASLTRRLPFPLEPRPFVHLAGCGRRRRRARHGVRVRVDGARCGRGCPTASPSTPLRRPSPAPPAHLAAAAPPLGRTVGRRARGRGRGARVV